VANSGQSAVFGRRKEPHTVIIARGDHIWHFTIRPWVAALAGSAFAAIAIGYLLATSYLVLRDDLLGATAARQARIQQAYEDRISALRAQVDRITSRQLLDQQLVESKVSELLQRQSQLYQRHGRMEPMLDRAEEAATPTTVAPVADEKPDVHAALPSDRTFLAAFASDTPATAATPFSFWSSKEAVSVESTADRADRLFVAINTSLRTIEKEQLIRIDALAENAYQTADAIKDAIASAGLSIDLDYGKQAEGGPLIAIDKAAMFETKVKELDAALDALDALKQKARKLPIANPAPGLPITSTYGIRRDPILGIPALHSGMDFRAPVGTRVHATAPGIVVAAGSNGGYGRMVEIDHGNGFSTRYAHLSLILVKPGQRLKAGDVVGESGSTGRSTGPHLHYEVRRNGDAVDPLRFLKAGKTVAQYL
jgi:murein DD-endopeptidase MepM/ murein hydrolase activator NlpD